MFPGIREWHFISNKYVWKCILALTLLSWLFIAADVRLFAEEIPENREEWSVDPQFDAFNVVTIAVMPMDNFSLEPLLEESLQRVVQQNLEKRGYRRVPPETVSNVMKELGIKTPGQLAGIKPERLKKLLQADALLYGQVDQSAAIHAGAYDALVVSCSLRLVHAQSGKTIWRADQWRTAKRQWQLDPLNMLLNMAVHEKGSRTDRIAALAAQMMKTLPESIVMVDNDNLLDQANEIKK
jgi:hypothetical protein